ncbi:hypothetical protein ABL975_28435 [Pseudomonas aeruginosa]|uniref:hypothetical protein n=1 Tax=Pseudomonas aeruginosa TaxID=287 RepID=UPI0005A86D19|nr:hypothetical protein [Pseudomonas aeruginosa]MDV8121259.1 hypothetical protein [Pseudomonas aeruginosa]QMX78455.1 hypothetical protein H5J27_16770 [Pseudomonas aeruginosa]RPP75041.1 hypothetical protein IPC1152_25080 [Pseudomonas aeruginosa]UEG15675.1 hypothetical protein LKM46_16660 [Pseudomonas aeruginosa]HCD9750521.1 hypothetical protein [Pseudomonas aeruginosa]
MKVIPSFPRYMISPTGEVWDTLREQFQPVQDVRGYASVTLSRRPDQPRPILKSVASLLLETYQGPSTDPRRQVARFKDRDRSNLSLDNLYWGTSGKPELEVYVGDGESVRAADILEAVLPTLDAKTRVNVSASLAKGHSIGHALLHLLGVPSSGEVRAGA